ncbi:MAG: CysB family transcriptional regulator [Gammaproteobacteria bacterium SG8_30]|jgi:LysR family cys regulon transcriptional activator|nr:MAG: CysB family transcriptional regulator [Gammaproteobacteria bacterium SG8_30]
MKLHQLRYLAAVVDNGLNITAAARALHTSQPGVSKQIKLFEEELGFEVFEREGRTLTRITPEGRRVVERAQRILDEVENIRRLSDEYRDETRGSLSIGTTHTQARYVLPSIVKRFRQHYPDVKLHLHQGTSEQIADLAAEDRVDFAIATGSRDLFPSLALMPCYRWHRDLLVPRTHPLAGIDKPTLKDVAKHPVVTYVFSFSGRSSLPSLFERAGLKLNVALTARDADVIKTYVRLGLGVGIVACMAIAEGEDTDLVAIDGSHLFPEHVTWLGARRGRLLRGYMYDFMQLFAPHLTRKLVDRALRAPSAERAEAVFADLRLPRY